MRGFEGDRIAEVRIAQFPKMFFKLKRFGEMNFILGVKPYQNTNCAYEL